MRNASERAEAETAAGGRAGADAPVRARRASVMWADGDTAVALARVMGPDPTGAGRGRARRARDVAAGGLAERSARNAVVSRFGPRWWVSTSRAHSEGRGAAVATIRSGPIGLDLVRLDRADDRVLRAIATPAEARLLQGWGPAAPAVAWGAKEACLKAFGVARCRGVTGVRLRRRDGRLYASAGAGEQVPGGDRELRIRLWRAGDWLVVGAWS